MTIQSTGASSGSGPNRSSRMLIIVIGCLILGALAAAMLAHSNSSRPSLPNSGSGTKTQQH
jgi:hypothetical protein